MCTVTYLPLNNSSFILTSNRDESRYRKIALPPAKYPVHGNNVYFPKDMDAYGTWFAAGAAGFTLCILNGAFEPHPHKPPYRLSRGIMLLDFFQYNNVADFRSQYDFSGIEPFTLLIFEQAPGTAIHEMRWDGQHLYYIEKDASKPLIWSSAQLYPVPVIRQREQWFDEWLKAKNDFTIDNIVHFHKTGGTGNRETDLKMNRDGIVFTVSITSVKRGEKENVMRYEDLVSGTGVTEIKII